MCIKIARATTKKIQRQSVYRGNIPQQNKTIYDKPRANVILNSEKLSTFL